jgi:transcriptional regulator GlxA family with amidase domain
MTTLLKSTKIGPTMTMSTMSTPPIQATSRARPAGRHVSLLAMPDAVVSTLAGIYDVMNAPALMASSNAMSGAPFHVEIVGERVGPLELVSGVPFQVQRSIEAVDVTDIVIVPSVMVNSPGWQKGRYPELVEWLQRMHAGGAILCSACSGIFLLAETGLFDGKDATVHYSYAAHFSAAFPEVTVHPERVLVITGEREDLVTSGASMTWHDLALYLIARYAGATDAQEVARMYALQWHQDGLAPYITFKGKSDHGDAEIEGAQAWLSTHFSVASPVEEMINRSNLAERTFKRRFTAATGIAPIAYVQRLRIEDAKRRLERTDASVDDISWRVGYEDPAFFRRLFKRTTGLAPGAYRKRFRIPEFARS